MSIINTFLDPLVILDEMAINASVSDDNGAEVKFSEIVGSYYPLIQINTFLLESNYLQYFKLSSDSFLPELEFTFVDNAQLFKAAFYPKDGDIISVYLKSHQDDLFKPIRIDFDILTFIDLGNNEFTVRGIMNIPLITSEICKAYPELSSHEVFLQIAEELQLGFASNEDNTSDRMNWINAFNTYEKFINDTTLRTYNNDRSFFTSYIDFYYYLNLINVNKQFEDYEVETGILKGIAITEAHEITNETDKEQENEVDLFLTNHPTYIGSNIGIIEYKIINSSGEIWRNNGYKRNVQFFDLNDNEYYSFYVDPITTEGSENNSQLLKGRPGDLIYEDIQKYKYVGAQLSAAAEEENEDSENSEELPRPTQFNVHRNYHFSLIQNIQNNEEIKKITIKIKLPTINSQLYRYQTIPILFYETDVNIINTLNTRDLEVDNIRSNEGDTNNFEDLKLNSLLSGLYVIQGIYFLWDEFENSVKQELLVTRREWPIHLPKNFESKNHRKKEI